MVGVSFLDLLSLMKSRRSIRVWIDCRVEQHKIDKILEAAIWAPTGANTQALRFMVISSPSLIHKIADRKGFVDPPLVIVVVRQNVNLDAPNISEWTFLKWQDTGAAMMNMLLMAHALKLQACWVTWGLRHQKQWLEKLLELAEGYEVLATLFIGYSPVRIDLESYKHQGRLVKRVSLEDYLLPTIKTS